MCKRAWKHKGLHNNNQLGSVFAIAVVLKISRPDTLQMVLHGGSKSDFSAFVTCDKISNITGVYGWFILAITCL